MHRVDRFAAIARAYASSPESTLVVSPDNKSRQEINSAIRDELARQGKLIGEHTFQVLVRKDPSIACFDYDTIEDIILEFQYTFKDGGTLLATKALDNLRNQLGSETYRRWHLLSIRHDEPDLWYRLKDERQSVVLRKDRLPFVFSRSKTAPEITGITWFWVGEGTGSLSLMFGDDDLKDWPANGEYRSAKVKKQLPSFGDTVPVRLLQGDPLDLLCVVEYQGKLP
jgi:hypothetical protein